MRAIIVDDELATFELIEKVLTSAGIDSLTALTTIGTSARSIFVPWKKPNLWRNRLLQRAEPAATRRFRCNPTSEQMRIAKKSTCRHYVICEVSVFRVCGGGRDDGVCWGFEQEAERGAEYGNCTQIGEPGKKAAGGFVEVADD